MPGSKINLSKEKPRASHFTCGFAACPDHVKSSCLPQSPNYCLTQKPFYLREAGKLLMRDCSGKRKYEPRSACVGGGGCYSQALQLEGRNSSTDKSTAHSLLVESTANISKIQRVLKYLGFWSQLLTKSNLNFTQSFR